jgi:hypothetical protein
MPNVIAGRTITYKPVSQEFVDTCETLLSVAGFVGPQGQLMVNTLDFDKASQKATSADEAIIFNSMKGEIYERFGTLRRLIKSGIRTGVIHTVTINGVQYKLGEKTRANDSTRVDIIFYPQEVPVDASLVVDESPSF